MIDEFRIFTPCGHVQGYVDGDRRSRRAENYREEAGYRDMTNGDVGVNGFAPEYHSSTFSPVVKKWEFRINFVLRIKFSTVVSIEKLPKDWYNAIAYIPEYIYNTKICHI